MSEAKFTPGPWSIEKTTYGYGVRAPQWGYVAIHDTSPHDHWNEGQSANRMLIAAAPDLFEALKTLYEETADYIERNNLGDVHHNLSMQLARAALNKATGA